MAGSYGQSELRHRRLRFCCCADNGSYTLINRPLPYFLTTSLASSRKSDPRSATRPYFFPPGSQQRGPQKARQINAGSAGGLQEESRLTTRCFVGGKERSPEAGVSHLATASSRTPKNHSAAEMSVTHAFLGKVAMRNILLRPRRPIGCRATTDEANIRKHAAHVMVQIKRALQAQAARIIA